MAKPVRGRPSAFTQELAEEICSRLSEGEPLAQICRDEHMPTDRTVRNWREGDEAFSSAIACARETGFDRIALDALEIADDDGRDWELVRDPNGAVTGIKVDGEHVTRAKLRIDTRLKLLAKWDPKRYGERVTHQGDGDADPIKHSLQVEFVG